MAELREYKMVHTHKEELIQNTAYICSKSILNAENYVKLREPLEQLIRTSPATLQNFTGILFLEGAGITENVGQDSLVTTVTKLGIIPGLSLNHEMETAVLDERCAMYYARGFRFAKCPATVTFGVFSPTISEINTSAKNFVNYACICQKNGLIPFLEFSISGNQNYDADTCLDITRDFLTCCFKRLNLHGCILNALLFKPKMVTHGPTWNAAPANPSLALAKIMDDTLKSLENNVPMIVRSLIFLAPDCDDMAVKLPSKKPVPYVDLEDIVDSD